VQSNDTLVTEFQSHRWTQPISPHGKFTLGFASAGMAGL
jgi:hypothetical protein